MTRTAEVETDTRPGLRFPLLLTLGALAAFGPLSLDLYLPSLPRIADRFGASDGATSLSLSGCMIGLAVGQLIAGPLSDRLGRLRPLLFGLVAFVITSVLCAVAPALWFLIIVRVLQGFAGATGIVIGRAVVRDIAPSDRLAYIFSMLALVSGTAPVAAPLVGGALLHVMSWRGVFLVLAGVGAVITGLVLIFLRESLPDERRHSGGLRAVGSALHTLAHDRIFVGSALTLGFGSAAMFTYISLSSFVLQKQYGLTASEFSGVFAANGLGLVIAGRINAVSLRRTRATPIRMMIIALVIMLTADSVLVSAGAGHLSLWVLLPALFIAVACTGFIFPNATATGLAEHAHHAGTASALLGMMQFGAGAIAGPIASSFGVSATSMTIAMGIWAALATTICLTLLARGRVSVEL